MRGYMIYCATMGETGEPATLLIELSKSAPDPVLLDGIENAENANVWTAVMCGAILLND